VTQTTVFRLYW